MYQPGETIEVPGVDFSVADQTLVLVVRKGCGWCERSMPFYREITANKSLTERTRLVAAAPDPVAVSIEDLAKSGVRFEQVVQVSLGQVRVRGTPTAILVGQDGKVRKIWPGWLSDERQQEVLSALKTGL
jgi:thioredoxin-related protein